MNTVCHVRSIKNGVILQDLAIRGDISPDGHFVGIDGMSVTMKPVKYDNKLYGYSLIKQYKVDAETHTVQWYLYLQSFCNPNLRGAIAPLFFFLQILLKNACSILSVYL